MGLFASVSEKIGDDDQLAGLKNELGDEVLVTLVDMAQTNMETGLQKVKEALDAGDSTMLREVAHSLKGSTSSLCSLRFSEMAAAIEQNCNEIEQVKENFDEFEAAGQSTMDWWQSKRP
ncbi:Hpt domain-containing protein [Sneathiella limimaris]|uniref:Hpt domain-containing protein n=1 Tax=Sneathiella limimaris TaxID=1964213 RepID=UPI00146A5EE9|nr:Hpt domain-containing protein [Sneathiella limimaris]